VKVEKKHNKGEEEEIDHELKGEKKGDARPKPKRSLGGKEKNLTKPTPGM